MDDIDLPPIATTRARCLFAYLVMHPERAHTRDLLAGKFWSDYPDTVAKRRLSQALWRIRQAFLAVDAKSPLTAKSNTLQFDNHIPRQFDVIMFEEALVDEDRVNEPGGGERKTRAGISLKDGVELYCGDFMDGFYDDWIILERERLRDLYLDALERLVIQCKEAGDFEGALRFARQLALAEPLRETAHCEIIRLCRLLERPHEAMQQYEVLKDILSTELGIDPSPTTSELYDQLLQEDEKVFIPQHQSASTSPFLDDTFSIPLVGREAEYTKLIACVDAAMQGNGGIALVEGEAGIGKTRLLQEIARDAGWRGVQVLWGRGQDRSSVSAYDILRQILLDGLSPLRTAQLVQLVDDVWLSSLQGILPELTGQWPNIPPCVPLKTEQEQKRVHEAFKRVMLSLGDIIPHLLILEDVHWATNTDLSALLYLMSHLTESRIFIIISFRGYEAQERPTVWEILQRLNETDRHERFELKQLTNLETTDLVRLGLELHQPAPRFTHRVFQETGGNPLFVLETLRALHDEGVLYQDEFGRWNTPWDMTTTDYAELPVPPGVHQVIARRLSRLSDDERAILNAAAILGDRFDFSLLSRLVEQDGRACAQSVNSLISRRLLVEEPSSYHFSHNLIRQVIIMGMSKVEKRLRHRVVVAVLEEIESDQVEALAYHATYGEMWDKSIVYNRKAGNRARAIYAGDKAIEFYTHSLGAWRNLEDESNQDNLALLQDRGEIFQETGQFDLAEDDFRAVIALAAQMNRKQAHVEASNCLSYLHFQRGDYDMALEVSTHAHEIASHIDSELLLARSLLNSANALRNMGRSAESIGFYQQAAEALEVVNDEVRLADCLNRMGYAYIFNGQLAEAEVVMQRGLVIRRRLDEKVGLSYSLSNLSGLHFYQGDFLRSKTAAEEAYEVAVVAGDPYGQDAALHNLGSVHLQQGSLSDAIDYFERAIATAREIGDKPLVAEALADMGHAYARKDDLLTGLALLQESLVCFDDGGEIWYLCKTHEYIAEISLVLGDGTTAREQARQALDVASELNAPYLLGTAHRMIANTLVHDAVNLASADPMYHFDESVRYSQEGKFHASLARTLADYGHYLFAGGDEQRRRGAEMIAEARAMFEEMGMTWDLASLEKDDPDHTQTTYISVILPQNTAPTGRPLRNSEWVEVIWTIATVADELIVGKVAKRRHRLLRLLKEAEQQDAAPRVNDVAQALAASPKTIKRDLAALREAGHNVRTRGSRS